MAPTFDMGETIKTCPQLGNTPGKADQIDIFAKQCTSLTVENLPGLYRRCSSGEALAVICSVCSPGTGKSGIVNFHPAAVATVHRSASRPQRKTLVTAAIVVEKKILLPFRRNHALGMPAAVVLRHSVLPFQEFGHCLRLDADLDTTQ